MIFDEEIDQFIIVWEGVDLSLNKWYANRHWSFRNKEKERKNRNKEGQGRRINQNFSELSFSKFQVVIFQE
jgi:pantothenate kinase